MRPQLEFEVVNKLYLELSQVATATTGRELKLMEAADFIRREVITFVNKTEQDDGMLVSPTPTDMARLKAAVNALDGVVERLKR